MNNNEGRTKSQSKPIRETKQTPPSPMKCVECTDIEKDLNNKLIESEDKFARKCAEFENYKKRTQKEKEEIRDETKVKVISSILDMDNDISIALKNIKSKEALEGIKIISQKVNNFLKSNGIEKIQTNNYDADIHEVISTIDTNESPGTILDVVSEGYSLNGKTFRYPKVIISK